MLLQNRMRVNSNKTRPSKLPSKYSNNSEESSIGILFLAYCNAYPHVFSMLPKISIVKRQQRLLQLSVEHSRGLHIRFTILPIFLAKSTCLYFQLRFHDGCSVMNAWEKSVAHEINNIGLLFVVILSVRLKCGTIFLRNLILFSVMQLNK